MESKWENDWKFAFILIIYASFMCGFIYFEIFSVIIYLTNINIPKANQNTVGYILMVVSFFFGLGTVVALTFKPNKSPESDEIIS